LPSAVHGDPDWLAAVAVAVSDDDDRDFCCMSSWLPGSGRLFGRPADSRQAGQGGAGEDLADVVKRDDHLLDPVQGCVLLPVQQDAPVLLGGDSQAGELDLGGLRAEQDLDGGVESQGEGGQFGGGEGALPAFGLVDGLPAPRPAQVASQGLAQVGQRQLPLGPEACDLPPDDLFDPHPRSLLSSQSMTAKVLR
jgi:hypothetical protein